jgi:biopolymer transport protein ExbD
VKFKRQSQVEESVNLTPLIDVVFLLLIFFMVSTTFTKETQLTIDLPEADSELREQTEKQTLEVLVNAEGNYLVNSHALINNSLKTLKAALSKESGGDSSMPLIITADANTSHQAVVRVMDAAGQLGFVHLSITTKNSPKE